MGMVCLYECIYASFCASIPLTREHNSSCQLSCWDVLRPIAPHNGDGTLEQGFALCKLSLILVEHRQIVQARRSIGMLGPSTCSRIRQRSLIQWLRLCELPLILVEHRQIVQAESH